MLPRKKSMGLHKSIKFMLDTNINEIIQTGRVNHSGQCGRLYHLKAQY
jgi:hypothetical protein